MIGTLRGTMTMLKTLLNKRLENREMHPEFGLHSDKLQVILLEKARNIQNNEYQLFIELIYSRKKMMRCIKTTIYSYHVRTF